ncbi:MAG: DUF1080 domain-containing protein [Bacteroidales bacterium]
MNKKIFHIIAIAFLSLLTTGVYAQDNRTLDTRVADILAQFPAGDLNHRDKVLDELIELGPEGFDKLSGMLTPAGTGDDTAVRFAMNSLARYVSEFGREEERELIEGSFLKALKQHRDVEVKTFLLNQLNLAGGERTIESAKEYLTLRDISEPATQTLLSIGTPAAAQAIHKALGMADQEVKITLITALGNLQYDPAVSDISPYASDQDIRLRKAALEALARIGNPESYKLLLRAAKKEDFAYGPEGAAGAFLLYTRRLGEREETRLLERACKQIFRANREEEKLHNYTNGLAIYAGYFGYEALPLLLGAMENDNKAFRYAVLNIALDIGGVAGTRQWIDKGEDASPTVKAEIIDMLGRRGNLLAVDFIRHSLRDQSPVVRQEAITALAKLQNQEAVPVLIDHLTAGNDPEATRDGLLQLLSQKHLYLVADAMKKSSGTAKAAFIDIISAKTGYLYFDDIIDLTTSPDQEVRVSAFNALQNISTPGNLDRLLTLLLSVQKDDEISMVQSALIAAAVGIEREKTENGLVIRALENTNQKDRIIPVLPEIGGEVALKKVSEYFLNSQGKSKETAFQALISWKDYSAAESLYQICSTTSGEYSEKAFANFVRQVSSASITDDQKLLQYRRIMPHATGDDSRRELINATGNLGTFLSLVYLKQFLKEETLQQSAARAIMKIALPNSEGRDGFSGRLVREMLEKSASLLEGEESEYDIININNYLEDMPREEGFISLFNGKDLEGWQGLVGNPITRTGMSEQELSEKQREADRQMKEYWKVKDNSIVFNGNGANLCSVKEYGDFEMIVDWRITKNGDSGIYLRGTPQVQIWDTSRVNVGAQVGSGGLYNNQKHESKPLKVADNPVGEWNTFHITMIGENVTVFLNGELVVDNVPLENYWDRSQPIFEKGPVELQAHGTDLAFRDIYIREIDTREIGLSREEKAEGFVSLFNGKNLDGWQGNTTDYVAADGEMIVQPAGGGHGNLFTEKEYGDFIFRFDFQLTPGANNGLGIRAPLEGDAAYAGMELQILDNTAPIYSELADYQYHGSVYGVIPARRGFLKPVGEWNSQEVVARGDRITITLNGTVILDGDIAEASENGTIDGREHPGLKRAKGYIGFLGHGSELKFRNIRIKDLDNPKP